MTLGTFSGKVIKGKGKATEFGVPTLNIKAKKVSGIFAAQVLLEGRIYTSVAYGDVRRGTLEAHLFHFEGDAVGKKVQIELLEKLRDDAHFEKEKDLRAQIKRDVAAAKHFFKTHE